MEGTDRKSLQSSIVLIIIIIIVVTFVFIATRLAHQFKLSERKLKLTDYMQNAGSRGLEGLLYGHAGVKFTSASVAMMRYLPAQGLVFLVDASDGIRLDEARRELALDKDKDKDHEKTKTTKKDKNKDLRERKTTLQFLQTDKNTRYSG